MMNISEEQYDWLLTWYKKTAEEELLEPLKESLKLTSVRDRALFLRTISLADLCFRQV